MMQAMLRGNWTIKVWCHKLSLLLMIDLKPSFRCVQRQTPDIWVMFLDTSRNHIVRVVLGSCRRWTSSCDEFHKAVLSRNSRLSPCFAIMTCVKRKDRKRCVYRHWQTKHVYSHIYIIYWINIYMCIYIYLYTPYTLEVQLTNQSVWCLRWSHGFPQRFSPPIKGGGVWTPCNSGLVNLNPWMGWQNKKSQWFLRYVFSLPTPGHAC